MLLIYKQFAILGEDRGAAFSRTVLNPRWHSANVPSAEVTLSYPASAGYCSKYGANGHRISLHRSRYGSKDIHELAGLGTVLGLRGKPGFPEWQHSTAIDPTPNRCRHTMEPRTCRLGRSTAETGGSRREFLVNGAEAHCTHQMERRAQIYAYSGIALTYFQVGAESARF